MTKLKAYKNVVEAIASYPDILDDIMEAVDEALKKRKKERA